ncbi:McrB family protein [Bisgaard Taxon 45]
MHNSIYPIGLSIRKPNSLKLGIKSSMPKIHSALALLYFLWKSNNMPYSLAYTSEIQKDDKICLVLNDSVKTHLLSYIRKYYTSESVSEDEVLAKIEANPLLTSQIESLIVAFELVWKLVKISFLSDTHRYSSERTGKNRYSKKLEFTNLIDIFDTFIETKRECYELCLFKWIINGDSIEEKNDLVKLITILADESIYKIQVETNDIIFTMGGVYQRFNGNSCLSIHGDLETKGTLRVLGNILDSNLNYFINGKNKNKVTLSSKIDKEFIDNYAKRTLLKFDLQHLDLNELGNVDTSLEVNTEFTSSDTYINLSKSFLILAGISGTGKTRFVREQAKRWSKNLDNYCLIPVRPDWHEPSDLLGYVSRLSGNEEYVVTDLLKFLVKAWRALAQELTFEGNAVKGSEETLGRINPFWLCLDEMNLAPVEQYFADYLSILETREWEWEGSEFKYRSDGLLSVDLFNQFKTNSNFLRALGFQEKKDEHNENDKRLLEFFEQNGIPLPFNLIVAGTVNMDETTHGFSRKVLDRALSFDFSEFYPNNFEQFFEPQVQAVTLTYPHHSTATKLKTNLDSLSQEYNIIEESLNFLGKINELFIGTPFKLAYRALNELLLNVWSFQPSSQAELQAVWDDFLMLKVLPRLEGDQDKLAFDNEHSLFDKLETILQNQLSEIWAQDKSRVDFFNEDLEGNKLNNLQCRSRQKLEQMKKQLERQHFTTFWQ